MADAKADLYTIDNGGGTRCGLGLYMMVRSIVFFERHDIQCRPGFWRVGCCDLSDFAVDRISMHAVVDDFGNLVRVP